MPRHGTHAYQLLSTGRAPGLLFEASMKCLIVLALLPLSAIAGTANLSWVAPTQYTDGSSIAAPITYKVYGGVQGQAKTVLATVSTLTYTHSTAPNGVTYCYQVSAVVNTQESAQTAEVCKVMPPLVPNPPTGLQVTVATAYRMRLKIDGYDMVAMGTVPLGTVCVEGKTVDGLSPVPRAAVTMTSKFDTLPVVVFAKCG